MSLTLLSHLNVTWSIIALLPLFASYLTQLHDLLIYLGASTWKSWTTHENGGRHEIREEL